MDGKPDTKIDRNIISLLKKQEIQAKSKDEKIGVSTQGVVNKARVSWATANSHLLQLQAKGMVEMEQVENPGGVGMKRMWRLKNG
jgi:predicted ArsR family transcriptional regulator